MIPYQHCTVSGKNIAAPAWFYVYSVMLMQQSPASLLCLQHRIGRRNWLEGKRSTGAAMGVQTTMHHARYV